MGGKADFEKRQLELEGDPSVDHVEDKTKKVLLAAILHFGHAKQQTKAIEEMAELTKEICKFQGGEDFSYINLAEEMADVEIMLEQIKLIYDIHSLVEVQKAKKLNRLRERLKAVID